MKKVIKILCALALMVLASLDLMCTAAERKEIKSAETSFADCVKQPAVIDCELRVNADCDASSCKPAERAVSVVACWRPCLSTGEAGDHG